MDDPSAQALTAEAEALLGAAVGSMGSTLDRWRIDSVHSRPGAETSAGYHVVAGGENLYLIASTVELTERERAMIGAVRISDETREVNVWRHPSDPRLPGLADACVPERLSRRLTRATGEPHEVGPLTMLVLRPMRRAVLRAVVTTPEGRRDMFVKVLRPDHAERVAHRYALTPLAPPAHHLGDGIVVVAQADGSALTELLHRPDDTNPAVSLDPEVLVAALDALPERAKELDARPSPAQRLTLYAEAAVEAGLDRARVDAVAAAIQEGLEDAPGPVVATHGDFHPANVFLHHDRLEVAALIDVDTLGPGYRSDDLACMVAHLLTLRTLDADGYPGVDALAHRVLGDFADRVPGRDLAARAAAVLISLVPGAETDEVRDAWLTRAESLVLGRRIGVPQ